MPVDADATINAPKGSRRRCQIGKRGQVPGLSSSDAVLICAALLPGSKPNLRQVLPGLMG